MAAILAQWCDDLTDAQRYSLELVISDNNSSDSTPAVLHKGEDKTITDAGICLALTGASLTFISSVALRRALILNQDYTAQIGSNIIQTYFFLDALAASRAIRIVMQPLVGVRENNSAGYSYYQVFVTNFLDALDYACRHGYTNAAVRKARQTHLRHCLFPHVRAEKMNKEGNEADLREGARRMLQAYGLDPFLLLLVLPVLLLPKPLLLAARTLAKRGRM